MQQVGSPFGEFIKGCRTREGLTQKQVAAAAGIQRTYLIKIEKGEIRLPQYELRRKLGNVLGFTEDDLAGAGILADNMELDLLRVPYDFSAVVSEIVDRETDEGTGYGDYEALRPLTEVAEVMSRRGLEWSSAISKLIVGLDNAGMSAA